jgi:thiol-disulfide isomerase/thioredoxin
MQKKWTYVIVFILMAFAGYYLYQKYRVAPDLKIAELPLETLGRQAVSLDKYLGKKTALCFAASWCGPCRMELKMIGTLKNTSLKELNVVVISDEDPATIEQFKRNYPADFEWLHLKQPFSNIGINSIPTTYLVNRKGVIVKQKVGYIDWQDPSTANYMLGLME